jgi:glutamyl-tRNA synthetase
MQDVNSHYIRGATTEELLQRIKDLLPALPNGAELASRFETVGWDKLAAALPTLQGRAKTLRDLVEGARYVIAGRPLTLDDKASKLLEEAGPAVLPELLSELEKVTPWQPVALEAAVRAFAERTGQKLGKVAQPLRAALTGTTVSPPVFDVMAVLGREEALARIRDRAQ